MKLPNRIRSWISTPLDSDSTLLLDIVLSSALLLGLTVLALRLWSPDNNWLGDAAQDGLLALSLVLIAAAISLKHRSKALHSRNADARDRQLQASLAMFTTVKHALNNDMQVVIGNAELAGMLIESGSDATKPVKNISEAASSAIDRIEQLAVFSASSHPRVTGMDLNAMLRESTAGLAVEIPAIVTLRLELEQLSSGILADRDLLSLSLSYLIRQVVKTLHHGGEIVIKTHTIDDHTHGEPADVVAELFVVHALSRPMAASVSGNEAQRQAHVTRKLQHSQSITEALAQRCGAVSVGHSVAQNHSLIRIGFRAVAGESEQSTATFPGVHHAQPLGFAARSDS